jgi:hypothetical protein
MVAEAYTVFWTQERCNALRRLGGEGKPLHTLFGGPHTSEPSFRRATVRPGDDLYPIGVHAGAIYVLGRVRVRRILTLVEYVFERQDLFAPYLREPPAWVLERGDSRLTPQYIQALEAFDRLRKAQPEYRYLASTCTDEVVECEDGASVRLDLTVPPDMLASLRYRSRRAERNLSKYIRGGRLMGILGVQGIYRLSEGSQREFEALLAGAAGR